MTAFLEVIDRWLPFVAILLALPFLLFLGLALTVWLKDLAKRYPQQSALGLVFLLAVLLIILFG